MCLDTAYFVEKWKHCSKIIFKYVNSVVRPIFNESFVEKRGLWVLWIVHGTHWNSVNALLKKKVKRRRWTPDLVSKRILRFKYRLHKKETHWLDSINFKFDSFVFLEYNASWGDIIFYKLCEYNPLVMGFSFFALMELQFIWATLKRQVVQ